jgi:Uma2 family endonuclease
MKISPPRTEILAPLVLRLRPVVELDDGRFLALSCLNGELRLKRTAEGELVVMPSTGGETSRGNALLTRQVTGWCCGTVTGVAFATPTASSSYPMAP